MNPQKKPYKLGDRFNCPNCGVELTLVRFIKIGLERKSKMTCKMKRDAKIKAALEPVPKNTIPIPAPVVQPNPQEQVKLKKGWTKKA